MAITLKTLTADRHSLVIVRLILSVSMAITAVVGFCVSVFYSVDYGFTHRPLFELSQRSVIDPRLLHALVVTSFISVIIPFVVVVDRCVTSKQSPRTLVSAASIQVIGAVFCGVIIVAMLGVIIAASASLRQLMKPVRPVLQDLLSNHTFMRREPSARWVFMAEGLLVNYLQTKFSCCGVEGYDDYAQVKFSQRHEGEPFPYSCCRLNEGTVWEDPDLSDVQDLFLCQSHNPDHIHDQGCLEPFQNWLQTKANFMIAYGSMLLLLSALLLASYVYIIWVSVGQPF